MPHLRIPILLYAVLGLLGVASLTGLSSCGGGETVSRETSVVTPIVVLTAENGGAGGVDLGGVSSDGAILDGGLIINWPVTLKAQVFMPPDSRLDGESILGDVITHVGKVHFEYTEDEPDETGEGQTWVAFESNVSITGNGYATVNNFQGLEGCPDILYVRAHFVPTTDWGGPKKSNGSDIGEAFSSTNQTFTMGTIDNPIQRVWITVQQGRGDDPGEAVDVEEEFDLNFDTNQPIWIPGTRTVDGEPFPIRFTLHVELKGVHNYTLFGKSHISDPAGGSSEVDFEMPMNVSSCTATQVFTKTFEGTSPSGMAPIVSHLFIGGSSWEIGDPHSATIPPPGQTPNQRPVGQLAGTQVEGSTSVAWNASASSDPDGSIVQYDWDFNNDGIIDLANGGPTQTYDYGTYGTVTARVVVTDNGGLKDDATASVLLSD